MSFILQNNILSKKVLIATAVRKASGTLKYTALYYTTMNLGAFM